MLALRASLRVSARRAALASAARRCGVAQAPGLHTRWLSSALPPHTPLTMPALSPTMEEGVVASWVAQEGDFVEAGQPVCEIETDKATVDFEVQDDGFLAKILAEAGGAPQPVGSVIGVLVEDEADVPAFANVTPADFDATTPVAAAASAADQPSTTPAATPAAAPAAAALASAAPTPVAAPTPARSGERIFASPLAKKLLRENGVELASVFGTGPNGRIVKADVEAYLASPQAQAQAQAQTQTQAGAPMTALGGGSGPGFDDVPVAADAQALARELEKSKKDVPHYYLNTEIDVTSLLQLRAELNAGLPAAEHVAVNDMLIRAAALCMSRVPEVNSSWYDTFIRHHHDCHVNVATLTPTSAEAAPGLGPRPAARVLMPLVRSANLKGLAAIAKETRALARVEAEGEEDDAPDYGVGTFTISNLGAYGLKTFTPIVREPQACSLGVGTIASRAVPAKLGPGGGGPEGGSADFAPAVEMVEVLTATLSCDHRVVDGAVGAQWLQEFKTVLQSPIKLLL